MSGPQARFATLLDRARHAYTSHAGLTAFCPFPDDVTPQPVTPFAIPSAALLAQEQEFTRSTYAPLCAAISAAAPDAQWRETYKGTDIGQDFLDRFGCYSIIGTGGPYTSRKLWLWMVYMPAHLHYPWHHHPGEEVYFVIGGKARFMRAGMPDEALGPGDLCFHGSNQPHAMETTDSPVLALVAWRNGFETPPVLTAKTQNYTTRAE